MNLPKRPVECSDCQTDGYNRRDFLAVAGAAAVAAGTGWQARPAWAAPTNDSTAEVAVKEWFATLTDEQKKICHLPLDDARRTKISANWDITKANIGSFTKSQQELLHKILKGITSEDGYDRFQKQMKADYGAVEKYCVALFGSPSDKNWSFALTGRHLTLRADGNTTENVAFGGPIVYGHGAPGNSDKNLFWYQTQRANEVYKALDEKQRGVALLSRSPKESAVELRDAGAEIPGLNCGEMSSDQQALVKAVLADLLLPYRKEDVAEVMEVLEAGGGLKKTHISFFSQGDLDEDGIWDVWRIESPTVVCHFRGSPHVHAYINVARRPEKASS